MLETLDYTIRIDSTPTFLYFDLYLYSTYAAHSSKLWHILNWKTIYFNVSVTQSLYYLFRAY